ncbi:uncharacterized protein LOC143040747 [Oratosquilla oratoria]|uniref:uncharacterized protein LOC143040747 n=1 Tax=Oratosquilla oratoria TaxID=337810 RepID=UPI003F7782CB
MEEIMEDWYEAPPPHPPSGGVDGELEPVPEEQFDFEEESQRRPQRRPGSFWKRPIIRVYNDNFGFGVNGYQSMIDYLDRKDYGGSRSKEAVHLPLLEERCMRQYQSTKPFKYYDNPEIDHLVSKGEKIRTQIRQNDAIGIGNVLNRTHTNWSMTKKWVQSVKDSHVTDYRKLREKSKEAEDFEIDYSSSSKREHKNSARTQPRRPQDFDKMTSDHVDLITSLKHDRMAHAAMMASRRERMYQMDDQFEETIDRLASRVQPHNRHIAHKIVTTTNPYSAAKDLNDVVNISDDVSLRNQLLRRQEMKAMLDSVDELTDMESSQNRLKRNLRNLDEEMHAMNDSISDMVKNHRVERLGLEVAEDDMSRAKADLSNRQALARRRELAELEEESRPAGERRRPRKPINLCDDETLPPARAPRQRDDVISDVQERIINKAGELLSRTSESRRINNRAKFINIYGHRANTGDSRVDVEPSRTERNIDYMARTLASKGKMQRKFDIEDEGEIPASNLNTYANQSYCTRENERHIEVVPSNSLRVRNATFRARARNSLLSQ